MSEANRSAALLALVGQRRGFGGVGRFHNGAWRESVLLLRRGGDVQPLVGAELSADAWRVLRRDSEASIMKRPTLDALKLQRDGWLAFGPKREHDGMLRSV